MLGWGLLSENGDQPSVLQKAKVPFLPYGGNHLSGDVVDLDYHDDICDHSFRDYRYGEGIPALQTLTPYDYHSLSLFEGIIWKKVKVKFILNDQRSGTAN